MTVLVTEADYAAQRPGSAISHGHAVNRLTKGEDGYWHTRFGTRYTDADMAADGSHQVVTEEQAAAADAIAHRPAPGSASDW